MKGEQNESCNFINCRSTRSPACEKTFDALSAVVAVDVSGSRAVVHCGNKLDSGKLVRAADKMGCTVSVLSEMQVDEGPRMAD